VHHRLCCRGENVARHQNDRGCGSRGIERIRYLREENLRDGLGSRGQLPAPPDDVFVAAESPLNQVLQRGISYDKYGNEKGRARLSREWLSEFACIRIASLGTG
jgi:hypothetical protein